MIAEAFAKWINDSLRVKADKLILGRKHRQQWQKILTPLLRDFIAQTEANPSPPQTNKAEASSHE